MKQFGWLQKILCRTTPCIIGKEPTQYTKKNMADGVMWGNCKVVKMDLGK